MFLALVFSTDCSKHCTKILSTTQHATTSLKTDSGAKELWLQQKYVQICYLGYVNYLTTDKLW